MGSSGTWRMEEQDLSVERWSRKWWFEESFRAAEESRKRKAITSWKDRRGEELFTRERDWKHFRFPLSLSSCSLLPWAASNPEREEGEGGLTNVRVGRLSTVYLCGHSPKESSTWKVQHISDFLTWRRRQPFRGFFFKAKWHFKPFRPTTVSPNHFKGLTNSSSPPGTFDKDVFGCL